MDAYKAKCLIVTDAESIPERSLNVIGVCNDDQSTANPLINFGVSFNMDGSGFAMIQCLSEKSHPDENFRGPFKPMTTELTRDIEIKPGAVLDDLPMIMLPGWQQQKAQAVADIFEEHCQTGLPIAQTTMAILPKR